MSMAVSSLKLTTRIEVKVAGSSSAYRRNVWTSFICKQNQGKYLCRKRQQVSSTSHCYLIILRWKQRGRILQWVLTQDLLDLVLNARLPAAIEVASIAPMTGLVKRPTTPFKEPLNIPKMPSSSRPRAGWVTKPVIPLSSPLQKEEAPATSPSLAEAMDLFLISCLSSIYFSSKDNRFKPLPMTPVIFETELMAPTATPLKNPPVPLMIPGLDCLTLVSISSMNSLGLPRMLSPPSTPPIILMISLLQELAIALEKSEMACYEWLISSLESRSPDVFSSAREKPNDLSLFLFPFTQHFLNSTSKIISPISRLTTFHSTLSTSFSSLVLLYKANKLWNCFSFLARLSLSSLRRPNLSTLKSTSSISSSLMHTLMGLTSNLHFRMVLQSLGSSRQRLMNSFAEVCPQTISTIQFSSLEMRERLRHLNSTIFTLSQSILSSWTSKILLNSTSLLTSSKVQNTKLTEISPILRLSILKGLPWSSLKSSTDSSSVSPKTITRSECSKYSLTLQKDNSLLTTKLMSREISSTSSLSLPNTCISTSGPIGQYFLLSPGISWNFSLISTWSSA